MTKIEKEYKGVWVLGEQAKGKVLSVTYELLTRGRELADKRNSPLSVVILGHHLEEPDLKELIERGADRVIFIKAPELEHFLCGTYSACILPHLEKERPEIFIAAATTTGRTLMPHLAIKANTGLTADCTELDIEPETGNLLQTRPAIGGNIMATIKTPNHRPQMATVRPRSTAPAQRKPGRRGDIFRVVPSVESLVSPVRRLTFKPAAEDRNLCDAKVVVCVGRGIKKPDNIRLARKLAEALNGSLGGTRDVVDRGWLEYSCQIGLSGKTVTPELYIGLGVSGSIQHLAGMQTSKTIIAINSDPDAQIFKIADFGLVGDLFEIVPVLIEKFRHLPSKDKYAE